MVLSPLGDARRCAPNPLRHRDHVRARNGAAGLSARPVRAHARANGHCPAGGYGPGERGLVYLPPTHVAG